MAWGVAVVTRDDVAHKEALQKAIDHAPDYLSRPLARDVNEIYIRWSSRKC